MKAVHAINAYSGAVSSVKAKRKPVRKCDLAAEHSARALYQEAATYCHGVKDYVTRDMFESVMKDEEDHIDFLETQLDLIKRVGLELYTQKHIGHLKGDEGS